MYHSKIQFNHSEMQQRVAATRSLLQRVACILTVLLLQITVFETIQHSLFIFISNFYIYIYNQFSRKAACL